MHIQSFIIHHFMHLISKMAFRENTENETICNHWSAKCGFIHNVIIITVCFQTQLGNDKPAKFILLNLVISKYPLIPACINEFYLSP